MATVLSFFSSLFSCFCLLFFETLDFSNIDLLLVGTGTKFRPFSAELKSALQNAFGLKLDFMMTGAACRTYNVLLAEGREVASLLYPLV